MAPVLPASAWWSWIAVLAVVLAVGVRPPPRCRGEFTVVVPDTSAAALVDAPQTGFSDRARTDPAEQRAVQEVMAATGNGWAWAIPDVCRGRWHGIECVPDRRDTYHVVSLAFGALSDDTAFPACEAASATLSPAVLALPHLRSLFFYRCFTGNPQPVAALLGRLGPAFRSLVLRQNGHVGPIPAELGNLKELRVLDLHGNQLTSAVPATLQSLSHLQLLDLSYNRLAGPVPRFEFPRLSILDLSHNALQGGVPWSLGQCRSLLKIDLSQNRLTGTIPDALGDLSQLMLLDLSHNALSGPIPAALSRLASLRSLILSDNRMQFSTLPDDFFAGLKALTTLVLSGMGLAGAIPESIGELSELRVLRLDNNQFTGVIPASFRRLERVSELRVDGNRLVGPIPFGKEMMWRLGKKLRVGSNEGLCYDTKQQGLEGVVALAGVADCDSVRSRTTQHLVWSNSTVVSRGGGVYTVTSSAASASRNSGGGTRVETWLVFVCLHLAWFVACNCK
ncbi:protein TOO MANY MOUTHS [Zea mays]|uniref:Protein TOO MANY MOUTHS n=1 Tax=Zea mays TaxID=4577 RepID=A0A1D6NIC1_MAIZE|nr:protein TOO MANY MOUTHS [Zea mays]ONM40115.1 Protein TOO MANY MOUTHS [Zea mays]|eukprot:XP_008676352.1 protein TOO MANY MOUTHS [Zea mays]